MRIPVRYHGTRVVDAAGQEQNRALGGAEKEPTMTNENQPNPEGRDAQDQVNEQPDVQTQGAGDVTGVPNGWPTPQDDLPPAGPPTSPTSGNASAAAARAAYEDAAKGRSTAGQPAEPAAPTAESQPEDSAPTQTPQPATEQPDTDLDMGALDGEAAKLAAERLVDLQRLQAEYVNYKRRVDRDREAAKQQAIVGFVDSLLPVLDEITLARQHGELEDGPFAKIAEKLENTLTRQGIESFGEVGEEFDPAVHEALMHTHAELPEGTTATTVVMVMQRGYRIGERIIRAARVSVADPA
ncbi:nucleotide exchange factor GrpE [Gephyromycinifex aptenodytis]|uniref:nucleotide exchange factor GrpE n=1 Tax=Gephyromycinifex aptenodytis TaxID=2716227 RepID=UPI001D020E52|nr:nucleotide exchange factor GrpE [Gephyromycinifex aptenodytis]